MPNPHNQDEWRQRSPETRWKTLEQSAAILQAIFPNYPNLDPCNRYDGRGAPEN
jgi:hypothetical protein